MWITTNGIDDGVSSMIGEAVMEEKMLRANSRYNLSQLRPDAVKKFHKLTVIGVLPKHKITYSQLLDGSPVSVMIKDLINLQLTFLEPTQKHSCLLTCPSWRAIFFLHWHFTCN